VTTNAAPAVQRLIVDRHVPIELRDGTTLRADVYRPEQGQYPVLVHRIPYNRQTPMALTNSMFPPLIAAGRGYAVVVQDTRGRFGSDGHFSPFRQEAEDGYDTIEWAAAQPWSNGRVAIYGSSYMGVTALQAVASAPPHLVTAIAYLTGGNYQNGWVYTGGALELLFNLRWSAGPAASELYRLGLSPDEEKAARARLRWISHQPAEALRFTPIEEVFGPAAAAIPFWKEWMEHPRYDDYWSPVDLTTTLENTTIPVLNVTGWYDAFLIGHLQAWATLQQGPTGVGHELLIGPWDHESVQSVRNNAAGDRFFGPQAVGGAAGLADRFLSWFDRHLKPGEDQVHAPLAVRYFHMGPDVWREATSWPPETEARILYLGSGGSANTRLGNGLLVPQPPQQPAVDSYVYDPLNPVPTRGGRHLGFQYGRAGVQDQAELELRTDILVYTGAALTTAFDTIGHVRATLHVRSSAPATDFTAKLVDVRPDGYCANVAEGILRVDSALGDLQGGVPLEITIDLGDTAYRFEIGHRVRLEISSSNFPRFDRHGNVEGPPSATRAADWVSGAQQLWTGSSYPSRVSMGGVFAPG